MFFTGATEAKNSAVSSRVIAGTKGDAIKFKFLYIGTLTPEKFFMCFFIKFFLVLFVCFDFHQKIVHMQTNVNTDIPNIH